MLASTFFDLVIGVDVHVVGIPAPPAPVPVPTPIPLPFVGMVFDPMGLAVGAAIGMAMGAGPGLVLVNNMPATNCGTSVTNMMTMPHLPAPGVTFIPPPKPANDAELIFGSYDVSLAGTLGVRLGEIALSCSDPVRMPTSAVLAIPKGPPVLILRPPVPDVSLIAQMLAMRALMRLGRGAFRMLRRIQRSSARWRRLSDAIHRLVNRIAPERVRSRIHRAVCFLTGHPVDVATGRLLTNAVELELPGPLPLRFERFYDSSLSWRRGVLGAGWSHSLDQELWGERGKVVYKSDDGREIEFDTTELQDHRIHPGQVLYQPLDQLTLRALPDLKFEVIDRNGVVHEFGAIPGTEPGRLKLLRKQNRGGTAIHFSYDRRGLLAYVVDSGGRTIHFDHNEGGQLTRVRTGTPSGQPDAHAVVEYQYDGSGDLIEARDALAHTTRYEYVQHLLVKETNRTGFSFYFQWNGTGASAKCTRTWGDGGIFDHVINYDGPNRRTFVEDSLGHLTTYQMDDVNQVVAVTDALGNTVRYEYDGDNGQRSKEIDPLGAETSFAYDSRGNVSQMTLPTGATLEMTYDARNLPVKGIDLAGGEWHWWYDNQGQMIGRRDPVGRTTTFAWHKGLPAAYTDPAGGVTQLEYNAQGSLAGLRTPDGAVCTWKYDHLGRAIEFVDGRGAVERRSYDAIGRLRRVVQADGNVRELLFDGEGALTHVRDQHSTVAFTHSGTGRLTSRTEAGVTIRMEYDREERLTSVTNAAGRAYRFTLSPTGHVDAEVGFDGRLRRYQRDKAGRVVRVWRPNGRFTAYEYDKGGRIVAVRHHDGTADTYTYRPDDKLMGAKNASSSVIFERDLLGRIVREQQGEDWIASEYNLIGLRTRATSSRGLNLSIARNLVGDVTSLSASARPLHHRAPSGPPVSESPRQLEIQFERDQLGLEMQRSLPGGVRARWQRDSLGRPLVQEITVRGRFFGARQYKWNTNERLQMIVDALAGPAQYAHDAVGTLVGAAYADGSSQLRLPDQVGNLFESRAQDDRLYGPAGELLQMRTRGESATYEYDCEGNLVRKQESPGRVWTYVWNGGGMLTKLIRPDGVEVEYMYDALGRRILKRVGADVTRWIWDGNVPLHEWRERTDVEDVNPLPSRAETDAQERARQTLATVRSAQGPPPLTTWIFEPESEAPLAKLEGDGCFGIVCDHLGTPSAMFDESGQQIWGLELDVWGRVRKEFGSPFACPFRFAGQYADEESGLCYNRFRYFDPQAGQYITQDPVGLDGGLALYAYVSDPTLATDFFGLQGGGSYGAVRAANSGGEVHHTPAWSSYSGTSGSPTHYSGPAIHMSTADHRLTSSHGSQPGSAIYRAQQSAHIAGGRWDRAIEMDVRDIQARFGSTYDANLREMLDYAESRGQITRRQRNRIRRSCGV